MAVSTKLVQARVRAVAYLNIIALLSCERSFLFIVLLMLHYTNSVDTSHVNQSVGFGDLQVKRLLIITVSDVNFTQLF